MREVTITLENCEFERVLDLPRGVYPVAATLNPETKQLEVRLTGEVPDGGCFKYFELMASGYAGWGVDHA